MRVILDFPERAAGRPGPGLGPEPGPGPGPRRTVLSDPVEVIRAASVDEIDPALRRVQDAVARGHTAAGYIAYEAAPAFEARMRVRPSARMPLLTFGVFRAPAHTKSATATPARTVIREHAAPPAPDWRPAMDRSTHRAAVERIRREIAAGRTYQVNLTTRFRAPFAGDPLDLHESMRRAQGPGYHAFLDLGAFAIASASPELFFETRGREITTRPMKGTRPRGRWPAEDAALREALATSPKDRAENLMIVDLLRNDLGRVARTGTVHVPRLLDIERYRTVWQMTSTIAATLRDDVALTDLFTALFPCGSVTGAPKISTMGLIAELEPAPRGVYCGAIGIIRPGGDATFSVPIRTAVVDRERGEAEYGAGGGIVWDSTAEGEYDEMLAKAVLVRAPWPEFRLLETMRLEGDAFVRLDRHLDRLRASADFFGFPYLEEAIGAALDGVRGRTRYQNPDSPVIAGGGEEQGGARRVRVLLDADGRVEVRVEAGVEGEAAVPDGGGGAASTGEPRRIPSAGAPRQVAVAASPVDTRDRFLYHKTTHREVHNRAAAGAPWAWDVILVNERGELTELTRGNLVLELDGKLVTPPVEAGLLAGCLRAELLEAGTITEATLRPADLDRASRAWFINSLRGWVEIEAAAGAGTAPILST